MLKTTEVDPKVQRAMDVASFLEAVMNEEDREFREILGPSQGVLAMVEGLRDIRKGFRVNMDVYASTGDGQPLLGDGEYRKLCCGCAATATILKVVPVSLVDYGKLYRYTDLSWFELALNSMRTSYIAGYLDYFFEADGTRICVAQENAERLTKQGMISTRFTNNTDILRAIGLSSSQAASIKKALSRCVILENHYCKNQLLAYENLAYVMQDAGL